MIVRTTVKSIQDIMRQDVGVDGDAQRIGQMAWLLFLKIFDSQEEELELQCNACAALWSIGQDQFSAVCLGDVLRDCQAEA